MGKMRFDRKILREYLRARRNWYWSKIKYLGALSKPVPASEITDLITSLHPKKTDINLIRIGGETDGGYLVPDDLEGISACFSPGVEQVATFEAALAEFDIPSYLADYSVDGPPQGFEPESFTKKFVGSYNDFATMTMDKWVKNSIPGTTDDLILQMDIEGDEYRTLSSTSLATLRRFRIILLEVHYLDKLENRAFFNAFKRTLDILLKDFVMVHIHPNNCSPAHMIDDVAVPVVAEFSLLRKDRIKTAKPAVKFPHPLDRDNVSRNPTFALPKNWYQTLKPKK